MTTDSKPIVLEDLDKIADEINYYECLMTKSEFQEFQYEYDIFMQRVYGGY